MTAITAANGSKMQNLPGSTASGEALVALRDKIFIVSLGLISHCQPVGCCLIGL
jgi:hypothetical protein